MQINRRKMYLTGVILLSLLTFSLLTSCKKFEKNKDYSKDSYDYWRKFIQEEKQEMEIIINWAKNDYFFRLEAYDRKNDIDIYSDNQKQKEILESEKDFNKVKNFLLKNQFDIQNDWTEKKRITFYHKFFCTCGEVFRGEYYLTYLEDDLEKEEDDYKKVIENYYSHVGIYQ